MPDHKDALAVHGIQPIHLLNQIEDRAVETEALGPRRDEQPAALPALLDDFAAAVALEEQVFSGAGAVQSHHQRHWLALLDRLRGQQAYRRPLVPDGQA